MKKKKESRMADISFEELVTQMTNQTVDDCFGGKYSLRSCIRSVCDIASRWGVDCEKQRNEK